MTFVSTTGTPPAAAPGPVGRLRMTPGRWVALAIGVPVAITLIGWTGFSLVTSFARGSYAFSYAVPVDNHQVAVSMNSGNVTLREGSGNGSAQLTGFVQYGLIRPDISEYNTNTGADIDVNCDGISAGNCGVNATLDVPAATPVALRSNGGDITASGFSSGVTLSASGGNVVASNLGGDLNLNTGGGDLTGTGLTGQIQISAQGGNVNASNLDGTTGTVDINTGGGDLSVNGITGNLSFTAYGGNINADGVVSPERAIIESGGGDVTLAFAQPPKYLQITAYGGNVTVILPPGGTKYNFVTQTDGGNQSYPTSLYSSTSKHNISINSGGGDISISQN